MAKSVQTKSITKVRDNIYDETEQNQIITLTRSGEFVGVLISPGKVDPKVAARYHDVIERNPEHGIQMLIKQATNQ